MFEQGDVLLLGRGGGRDGDGGLRIWGWDGFVAMNVTETDVLVLELLLDCYGDGVWIEGVFGVGKVFVDFIIRLCFVLLLFITKNLLPFSLITSPFYLFFFR